MQTLVQEIKEKIEILSLHDRQGWKEVCGLLEEVMGHFSGEPSDENDFLRACHRAFLLILNGKATDFFSLVTGLSKALDWFEEKISNGSGQKDEYGGAFERLNELIQRCAVSNEDDSFGETEEMGEAMAFSSLEEAGAFLIQIEPHDLDGIARLRGGLGAFLSLSLSSGERKGLVEQAMAKLGEILSGKTMDVEAAWQEVGAFLEKAMSQEECLPPTGPDPDAVREDPLEERQTKQHFMPQDLDADLVQEFVQEGTDLLSKAEEALLSLETDPEDMESVGMVFRAFHTIKGTSAFLGLDLVSHLAHYAESLLSRVREGEIVYGGGYADLSLRALDMLRGLMLQVQKASAGSPLDIPEGYDELVYSLEHPEEYEAEETTVPVKTPLRVGDILVASGEVDREQVEMAARLPGDEPLGTKILKTGVATAGKVAKALRAQRMADPAQQAAAASVRVDTERLDRLVDLVGEMVIAHSMIAQDLALLSGRNQTLARKVGDTSKIVRQLQDISMSLRMVPLRGVFQKMARLVRDLSKKVSKKVVLVTDGEETEIDRNMVDIINDPLVHMIRNAVDHGIESSEERVRTGKAPVGTVRLSAYHSAGNVVVEINDDGRGLDRDKILAKARAKGLIPEGASLSDREIYNLVFAPGFSTAEAVTDVSGRGVGMDVVKKNIESIRGQVDILSQYGAGSTFRMALPLTLAIIDGMVVRVGEERYILPTSSIVRSVKPEPEDLNTVLERGEMIQLQGELIPLFRLSRLFQVSNAQEDPARGLVTVIENDGKQVALLVDELIGRQQIVIKSLGETLRKVQGIAGGAVMPDGRIGLILDVGGLVRLAVGN